MAQTIQIKRNKSNAATKPSSLLVGELAGNLLDRSLFSSDGSNVFQFYTGTTKWFDTSGNANNANKLGGTAASSYATQTWVENKKYLTAHQSIYSLTINNSAGTAQVTYTPNSKAASLTLTKSMVGLSNVENTALSTWAGSSKITTLGTITSGTWNGTKIANSYLANSSMTIAGTSVSLGSSITAATLKTNLGLGSFAYISSLAFSSLTGKPTTLAGYGITDAISEDGSHSGNSLPRLNRFGLWQGIGAYIRFGAIDSYSMALRSYGGVMQAAVTQGSTDATWFTLLHSGNYSSYALPLSGGTIENNNTWDVLKIVSTHTNGRQISFHSNKEMGAIGDNDANGTYIYSSIGGTSSFLMGVNRSGVAYVSKKGDVNTRYDIIHSGNIGSYAFIPRADNLISNVNADHYLTNGAYLNQTGNGSGNSNFPNNYAMFLSFNNGAPNYVTQFDMGRGAAYYRTKIDTWSKWYQFITDENIGSQNVASATKLQTARTIWGQSFDGTANVSGSLAGVANISMSGLISGFSYLYNNSTNGFLLGSRDVLGGSAGGAVIYTYGDTPIDFYTGNALRMHIHDNGNVLIGTTNDRGHKFAVGRPDGVGSLTSTTLNNSLLFVGMSNSIDSYGMNFWTESSGDGFIQQGRTDEEQPSLYNLYLQPFGGHVIINSLTRFEGSLIFMNDFGDGIYIHSTGINFHNSSNAWVASCLSFDYYGNTTLYHNLTVTGDITSEGTMAMARLASSSDAKLKENIKWLSADKSMEVVRALRPTEWNWKKDRTHSFGFIAQDVQPIIPEMVSSVNDTLRLEYNQLHAFEIGAIQHIDSEVEQLKKDLKTANTKIENLENELKQYRRTAICQ